MIIKVKVDLNKAKSLVQMAKTTLERLKEIDNEKYPSNTLIDYYDSIHKLLEALALSEGVKVKEEDAHKELIDYVSQEFNLNESVRMFLQELRDYRNRISYEGFMINKDYIKSNIKKIQDVIVKLTELVKLSKK